MKKPINIRKNEIMSASLVHKNAFDFFKKILKINHNAGIESFLIKIPKYHNGAYVINMMISELKSDKFIELYIIDNKNYKAFSIKKELLLWSYHKHLEEYETVKNEEGIIQYLIPVNELTTVSTFIDEALDDEEDNDDDFDLGTSEVSMKPEEHISIKKKPLERKIPEEISKHTSIDANKKLLPDAFLMHLTARDLFSIIHAKPISNKTWINELVTNNK